MLKYFDKSVVRNHGGASKFKRSIYVMTFRVLSAVSNNAKATTDSRFVLGSGHSRKQVLYLI